MTILVDFFDRIYRLISIEDTELQAPVFIDFSLVFRILSNIATDLTHFEWAFTEGFWIVNEEQILLFTTYSAVYDDLKDT